MGTTPSEKLTAPFEGTVTATQIQAAAAYVQHINLASLQSQADTLRTGYPFPAYLVEPDAADAVA